MAAPALGVDVLVISVTQSWALLGTTLFGHNALFVVQNHKHGSRAGHHYEYGQHDANDGSSWQLVGCCPIPH